MQTASLKAKYPKYPAFSRLLSEFRLICLPEKKSSSGRQSYLLFSRMKPSGTSAEVQRQILEWLYAPTFAEQEIIAMTPTKILVSIFFLRAWIPNNETAQRDMKSLLLLDQVLQLVQWQEMEDVSTKLYIPVWGEDLFANIYFPSVEILLACSA